MPLFKFLMYRVELKVSRIPANPSQKSLFLMYRVELKAVMGLCAPSSRMEFLMYRVELKAASQSKKHW